jgi:hypothetical protein
MTHVFVKNRLSFIIGIISLTQIMGIVTVLFSAPNGSNILYLFFIQFLGPIGGCIDSSIQGLTRNALWVLLVSLIITFVPIIIFLQKRTFSFLILACVLWWFFGYMFAIGIWI